MISHDPKPARGFAILVPTDIPGHPLTIRAIRWTLRGAQQYADRTPGARVTLTDVWQRYMRRYYH